MKKIIYLSTFLVILVSFSITSHAQIQFGIKAGMNGNYIGQSLENPNDKINTKLKLGYHFGLLTEFMTAEDISFNAAIMYISKGVIIDQTNYLIIEEATVEGHSVFTYNYLEIPLNIVYRKGDFSVFGGPYIGLGLNGKEFNDFSITFDGGEIIRDQKGDLKAVYGEFTDDDRANYIDGFSGIDYGINVGIGYILGPTMISLGFSRGHNDLEAKREGRLKDNDSITNRVIVLSATYMFDSNVNSTEK